MKKQLLAIMLALTLAPLAPPHEAVAAKAKARASISYKVYMDRGDRDIKQGKALQASYDYRQALRLSPNNPWLMVRLGKAYYALKRYDEAADQFDQAIAIKPDFV